MLEDQALLPIGVSSNQTATKDSLVLILITFFTHKSNFLIGILRQEPIEVEPRKLRGMVITKERDINLLQDSNNNVNNNNNLVGGGSPI